MVLFYKHITPQAGLVADCYPVWGGIFIERSTNSNSNPVGVAQNTYVKKVSGSKFIFTCKISFYQAEPGKKIEV